MKKTLLLLLSVLITITAFGEEFAPRKIHEYQMGTPSKGLYLRRYEEVAPQDDISKNYLMFTKNGDLNIYQADTSRIIYLDKKWKIKKEDKLNLLIRPYNCMYTNNYLLLSDKSGRIYLFDMKLNRKAYFETFYVLDTNNTGKWLAETYYDEATDILFFRDSDEVMHSLVHPGIDAKENHKNYKTPSETLELFNSACDMKNLGLYKGKYLTVDEKVYYWAGTTINQINYQIFDNTRVNIWNSSKLKINCTASDEEVESIAIHPSGDIYILRINWKTNSHNLYYVKNTWDSEWRTQWYKEHPSAAKPE